MDSFEWAVMSHVGAVRTENEDAALVLTFDLQGAAGPLRVVLAAVADGVGGLTNGEVASRTALGALAAHVGAGIVGVAAQPDPLAALARLLHQGVMHAGRAVGAQEESRAAAMATTLVAGLIVENQLLLANVGDSRAYLVNGGIQQLTRDHTLVNDLMAQGLISPDEAAEHPRRHEITRVLGAQMDAEPDLFTLMLQPGDLLLFCSDGVSGLVPPERLAARLGTAQDLQAMAAAVVAEAVELGAPDNLSLVLVRATGRRP